MADQGLVGFGALAARPAAHPGLDGPSAQPTEPGEQSEHQRHGHQPRQRDRLAEEKQPRAEQLGQLIALADPGAGEVVVPVAGVEVVVKEITHHQAHIAVALEAEGRALQAFPVHALRVDVDAGLLAGDAGALLLAAAIQGAAHRLGDRGVTHVGATAQQTARCGIDRLHRCHRAEVLAPGLAAIEPTHGNGRRNREQQPAGQHQAIGIEEEDAAAQAHKQPAELECRIVPGQPGVGRYPRQLGAELAALGIALLSLALPAESPGDLGEERKRADPPPELMAEHQQDENRRRHHCTPEDRCAQRVGGFHQAAALHLHAGARQPQRAPGVLRTGEAGRERIKEQRADDQQPAGGEQPSHPVHADLAQPRAGHRSRSEEAER